MKTSTDSNCHFGHFCEIKTRFMLLEKHTCSFWVHLDEFHRRYGERCLCIACPIVNSSRSTPKEHPWYWYKYLALGGRSRCRSRDYGTQFLSVALKEWFSHRRALWSRDGWEDRATCRCPSRLGKWRCSIPEESRTSWMLSSHSHHKSRTS